jgi:hypothetical protein
MWHFIDIMDCPDVIVGKDQVLTMRYNYLWDGIERKRAVVEKMPMNIHLKDYIKIRQKTIQVAHRREQLSGEPRFTNIWASIEPGYTR